MSTELVHEYAASILLDMPEFKRLWPKLIAPLKSRGCRVRPYKDHGDGVILIHAEIAAHEVSLLHRFIQDLWVYAEKGAVGYYRYDGETDVFFVGPHQAALRAAEEAYHDTVRTDDDWARQCKTQVFEAHVDALRNAPCGDWDGSERDYSAVACLKLPDWDALLPVIGKKIGALEAFGCQVFLAPALEAYKYPDFYDLIVNGMISVDAMPRVHALIQDVLVHGENATAVHYRYDEASGDFGERGVFYVGSGETALDLADQADHAAQARQWAARIPPWRQYGRILHHDMTQVNVILAHDGHLYFLCSSDIPGNTDVLVYDYFMDEDSLPIDAGTLLPWVVVPGTPTVAYSHEDYDSFLSAESTLSGAIESNIPASDGVLPEWLFKQSVAEEETEWVDFFEPARRALKKILAPGDGTDPMGMDLVVRWYENGEYSLEQDL